MLRTVLLLAVLTLSACKGQGVQSVSVAPPFPPAPVDVKAPLPTPMLDDLKCLQETGLPCPGPGSSIAANAATSSLTK